MPTIDAAFGITIEIGLILGFCLAFVLFREKKVESLGFAPNDLSSWKIPSRYGNVFNKKSYVEWAEEELKLLEKEKKESEKEASRIEELVNQHVKRADQLKKEIESAGTSIGQRAKTLAFSNVMFELRNCMELTDTNNDLIAPYANRRRFLKAIIKGEDQIEVEDIMNKSNTIELQENPYVEIFKSTQAIWDAFNEIPSMNDKIMHEMLSIPKPEDN